MKTITIKNVDYTINKKEYIETASLGPVIKAAGLDGQAATYKAFTEAIGKDWADEREAYWLDIIDSDEQTQKTIEEYLTSHKGKLYGLNRKLGIQLGYIKKWCENGGMLIPVETLVQQFYDKALLNPEKINELIVKSGFTALTLYQYVKKHITNPSRDIVGLLNSIANTTKAQLVDEVKQIRKELTELKGIVLNLQKTK